MDVLRKRSTEWLTKIVHECHITKRWKAWCRNMSPGCRPPHWGKTSWCIRANRRNCMVSTNLKEEKTSIITFVAQTAKDQSDKKPTKVLQSDPNSRSCPKLPKLDQNGPKWLNVNQLKFPSSLIGWIKELLSVKYVFLISQETNGQIMILKTVLKSDLWLGSEKF